MAPRLNKSSSCMKESIPTTSTIPTAPNEPTDSCQTNLLLDKIRLLEDQISKRVKLAPAQVKLDDAVILSKKSEDTTSTYKLDSFNMSRFYYEKCEHCSNKSVSSLCKNGHTSTTPIQSLLLGIKITSLPSGEDRWITCFDDAARKFLPFQKGCSLSKEDYITKVSGLIGREVSFILLEVREDTCQSNRKL